MQLPPKPPRSALRTSAARGGRLGAALAMVMLVPAAARAATPDSDAYAVAQGRDLAMHTCAWCHQVGPGQEIAPALNQRTPSFVSIANRPKVSRADLVRFIKTTHWDEKTTPITMPGDALDLTDSQANQVVSYILSLRKRH